MLLNGKPDISGGPCNLSTTQPGLDNAPTLLFGATPGAALSPCRHGPADARRPLRREQTSHDRNNDNKNTSRGCYPQRGAAHLARTRGSGAPPEHSPTPVTAHKPRPLGGDGHWLSRGTRQGRLGRQQGEDTGIWLCSVFAQSQPQASWKLAGPVLEPPPIPLPTPTPKPQGSESPVSKEFFHLLGDRQCEHLVGGEEAPKGLPA